MIKNYVNDGNIYVFDRKTGKGIRKINRKGQGGEEYAFIVSAALDEDNEEIFVNSTKKILVYDLSGNFKRSFNTADDADYMDVFNYDKNNLICYDMTVYYRDGEENLSFHYIEAGRQCYPWYFNSIQNSQGAVCTSGRCHSSNPSTCPYTLSG